MSKIMDTETWPKPGFFPRGSVDHPQRQAGGVEGPNLVRLSPEVTKNKTSFRNLIECLSAVLVS